MAGDGDGRTSDPEWILLAVLLVAGVLLLADPVAHETGAFIDLADSVPPDEDLGPYGNSVAVLLLGASGTGLAYKETQ